MTPLESKLRKLASALDASALAALASKGLLRRAQKDLEGGAEITIVGQCESTLMIRVAAYEVKMPDSGPSRATCSCPATGVCQHILAAVLFLQAHTPSSGEVGLSQQNNSEKDELMDITPEALEEWAGKAVFKRGLSLIAYYAAEIHQERGIRIRFPALNAEVHHVRGAGLAGMIVSGGKTDEQQLVVAAVVAFQRAAGRLWPIADDDGLLEPSNGAPRTRSEVLYSCQTLLEETLAIGLSRLSTSNQQRWTTLAVSAVGVHLPRLALLMRGIGDEAALSLARDARSDLGRMLGRLAQTYALCSALQKAGASPRADLVGAQRTRYDEVGHIDLIGAAAWPWRTSSGYEGLTLLFWDSSAKRWNSWSDSRPLQQLAGFDPVSRFTQPGPWEGAQSPHQLARSSFRLMNARRNANQRLSSSGRTRALVTGPSTLEAHGPSELSDWLELSQRLSTSGSFGLREANPLDSIFAVRPVVWGDRGFNQVTQIFTWVLGDCHQRVLLLQVPFDKYTGPAIKFSEAVQPTTLSDVLIVGRVQLTPAGIALHPYSIHRKNGEIIHLCLDGVMAAASDAPQTPEEDDELFDMEDQEQSDSVASPLIARTLDEMDDNLLALAESGLATPNLARVEYIAQNAQQASRMSLQVLTSNLRNVCHRPTSTSLLRCCYVSQLHRRSGAALV